MLQGALPTSLPGDLAEHAGRNVIARLTGPQLLLSKDAVTGDGDCSGQGGDSERCRY